MSKRTRKSNKALLIDDSEIDLFVCSRILESNGFTKIKAFTNARDTLDYLKKTNTVFDYILVDIYMPLFDGFAFIETYRTLKLTGQSDNVYILSASLNPADKDLCRKNQIKFIEKPFIIEKLFLTINR